MMYTIHTQQAILSSSVDEQALAQAKLNNYIESQAEAVAPEHLTTVEISFYDHEYYLGEKLVAAITYDNDLTQPWVVMVNAKEKHCANTWAKCNNYITWHHKQGTLEAPLPTPQPEELTILEISYYDQEVDIGDYLVDSYLVASISFNHDNYQDSYWRVLVNGNEIYRDWFATRVAEVKATLPETPRERNERLSDELEEACAVFGLYHDEIDWLCFSTKLYRDGHNVCFVGCNEESWYARPRQYGLDRLGDSAKRVIASLGVRAAVLFSQFSMIVLEDILKMSKMFGEATNLTYVQLKITIKMLASANG